MSKPYTAYAVHGRVADLKAGLNAIGMPSYRHDVAIDAVHKAFANWKTVSPPGSVLLDDGSGWRKHFPEFQKRRSPNDHVEQKPLGNCPVHFGPLNPDGTCPLCEDAA